MKNFKKLFITLIVIGSVLIPARKSFAQLTPPHPFVDFSGLFVAAEPICLNGILIEIITPIPFVLTLPYVPITPIFPVWKTGLPIPDASTLGSFLPGGVCLIPTLFGPFPLPTMGTLVQIGNTYVPTPWFVPFVL
jgi:hypothetical protein